METSKMKIDLSGLRERVMTAAYNKAMESQLEKLKTEEHLNKMKDWELKKEYNEKVSNMIMGTGATPKVVGQMNTGNYQSDYEFVSFETIVKPDPIEYIDPDKIDYIIKNTDKENCKLKEDMTISFLDIKEGEIEKGKDWYLHRDPKLPDCIAELLARYNWGDLRDMPNKRQYKVKQKKLEKKGKDILNCLEIKKGPHYVVFD